MTEWLLLAAVGAAVAAAIGWPVIRRSATAAVSDVDDAPVVRHRLALEALRDVEADHRAGSLDEAGYAEQRAEAEAHAATTLAAVDVSGSAAPRPAARAGSPRLLAGLAALLALGVVVGFALPDPIGLGERTVVNQPLADAIAVEQARQAQIQELLGRIAADPRDADALSALADAYLAGDHPEDLQRGAAALLLLINVQPEDASAYQRLITAYIRAGDWTDARATVDAYAEFAEDDDADIPFFRGLIALRGDRDPAEAVRQFDRFLELAPDDPRAPMIRGLRVDAAAQLD
jgi:cytochrome c-type biogenesis protein CcmI